MKSKRVKGDGWREMGDGGGEAVRNGRESERERWADRERGAWGLKESEHIIY